MAERWMALDSARSRRNGAGAGREERGPCVTEQYTPDTLADADCSGDVCIKSIKSMT